MPDGQEIIALGIVGLVAGRLLWKAWARRRAAGTSAAKSGACGDCSAAGPPPEESTVHFYRRQNAEGPASGAPENQSVTRN